MPIRASNITINFNGCLSDDKLNGYINKNRRLNDIRKVSVACLIGFHIDFQVMAM